MLIQQPLTKKPSATSAAHLRLVVCCCGEDLALLCGDGGVACDHAREHTAQRLNTQAERSDIQQQDVLHIAAQHATLRKWCENGAKIIKVLGHHVRPPGQQAVAGVHFYAHSCSCW